MTSPNQTNDSHQFFLLGNIDRLEESQAVISLEGGQKLVWPLDGLPLNTTEGMAVKLMLKFDGESGGEQEEKAKAILKEILNIDDKSQGNA
jgi:hypothetical protein